MLKQKNISELFDEYVVDNNITEFPISKLTNCFNRLSTLTSYSMEYYKHRQAFYIIEKISKILHTHINEVKPNIGVTYRRIFTNHSDFIKWYISLDLPFRKYIIEFLKLGDDDFVKGFMLENEISQRFNTISWSNAVLIATFYLNERC